jgi:hypothetical protein
MAVMVSDGPCFWLKLELQPGFLNALQHQQFVLGNAQLPDFETRSTITDLKSKVATLAS